VCIDRKRSLGFIRNLIIKLNSEPEIFKPCSVHMAAFVLTKGLFLGAINLCGLHSLRTLFLA
jgi:hypothetical protein